MQLSQVLFLAGLLITLTLALAWGDKPERYGGTLLLLAALASPLAQVGSTARLQLYIALIDMAVWAGLVVLGLIWRRRWLTLAAACQTLTLLGHFARAVVGADPDGLYAVWIVFWSYPVLICLAFGSWQSAAARRQAGTGNTLPGPDAIPVPMSVPTVAMFTENGVRPDDAELAVVTDMLVMAGLGDEAPRQAEALLRATGSLASAINTTPERLHRRGVPAPVIKALSLVRDTNRALLKRQLESRPVLADSAALLDYLHGALAHLSGEQVHVLYLDARRGLLAAEDHGQGTVDRANVFPRELLRRALDLDASYLILAHNHPSGCTDPSPADVQVTRLVKNTLDPAGIALVDHIIAGRSGHTSLRALGYI